MPKLLHIKQLKKTIPTVKGDIDINMKVSDNTFKMALTSPNQTSAIIGIPQTGKDVKAVWVNDKLIWKKGKNKTQITGFEYVEKSSQYLKFKASSGTWNINAVYN